MDSSSLDLLPNSRQCISFCLDPVGIIMLQYSDTAKQRKLMTIKQYLMWSVIDTAPKILLWSDSNKWVQHTQRLDTRSSMTCYKTSLSLYHLCWLLIMVDEENIRGGGDGKVADYPITYQPTNNQTY